MLSKDYYVILTKISLLGLTDVMDKIEKHAMAGKRNIIVKDLKSEQICFLKSLGLGIDKKSKYHIIWWINEENWGKIIKNLDN